MDADTITKVDERRKHQRVGSNLPIQYRNLRKSSESPAGSLTKDISEGGISFKTKQFISLACRLVVEIQLPNTAKPIKAISKVAWIKKSGAGDSYELGNQFLEIAKEDKARIMDFVNQVLSTNL